MRAMQRGVGGGAAAARHPREGDQSVASASGRRAMAEDMQAVADLHLLQLAEMGVELRAASRRPRPCARCRVAVEAVASAQSDRISSREKVAAARIDAGGQVILVDQRLELAQRTVDLGAGQRRLR